jgi:hypothetical protein
VTDSTGANQTSRQHSAALPNLVNYYQVLDLKPGCSSTDIRRAYWQKSKLYHPDTTVLAPDLATEKFQQLNQAYATLSSPEQRLKYDQQWQRQQASRNGNLGAGKSAPRKRLVFPNSGYLDPGERSLSSGEIFALFILGLTFLACLLLAVIVGWSRGELALQEVTQSWSQSPSTPQPVQAAPVPARYFPHGIAPPPASPPVKLPEKPLTQPPVSHRPRLPLPSATPIHPA